MINSMLPLHSLSPVSGKSVVATFDGGLLSSDGGVLMLREVEQRLRIADRFAGCIEDPRAPDQITHALADIIRFRLLMIAAGYEDGNDANGLRVDPIFKMAHDLTPSDHELCSQSTISRLENLPDVRALLRMGRAMVDLYCESFRQVPKRIVLDIDDTFDAVHGGQQLRLFNAHYDEYGFQPIVVFDGEGRFVTAVLRPAKRPGGKEIRTFLRRLLRAIRTNWPNTQDIAARRQPLLLSGSPRLVSSQWSRYPGRRADHDVAPAYRGPRGQHEGALRGRAEGRQGAPLQGVLRRGRQLEPRRADRRPCGGRRGRARHTLHRHQPEGPQRPCTLRGCLLPARPGGKPYQVLEDASGGRPHLVHQGRGQPAPAVPARRRILAHVGSARVDAQALDVARRAVRYVAPALINVAARVVERKTMIRIHLPTSCPVGYFASRARAYPAPRHLSDGAQRPECRARPINPQTFSTPPSGSLPERMRCVRERAKPETITRARWRARRSR